MSKKLLFRFATGMLVAVAAVPSAFAVEEIESLPADAIQPINKPLAAPISRVPNFGQKLAGLLSDNFAATPAAANASTLKVTTANQSSAAAVSNPVVQQVAQQTATAQTSSGYSYFTVGNGQGRRGGRFLQRLRGGSPMTNAPRISFSQGGSWNSGNAFNASSIPGGTVILTAMRDSGIDLSNPGRAVMMLTVPYYPLVSAGFNTARGLIGR